MSDLFGFIRKWLVFCNLLRWHELEVQDFDAADGFRPQLCSLLTLFFFFFSFSFFLNKQNSSTAHFLTHSHFLLQFDRLSKVSVLLEDEHMLSFQETSARHHEIKVMSMSTSMKDKSKQHRCINRNTFNMLFHNSEFKQSQTEQDGSDQTNQLPLSNDDVGAGFCDVSL